jgi:hypothetical protein
MTTLNITTEMPASVLSNGAKLPVNDTTAAFGKALVQVIEAKEEFDGGAFALLIKHRNYVESISSNLDIQAMRGDAGDSVRSVLLNSYYETPIGKKNKDRYDALVSMKANIAPSQRTEKETLKKRFSNVNTFMVRVIDTLRTIKRIEELNFTVQFRTVAGTALTVCRLTGPSDDESCAFSNAQIMKLADQDISAATSFAHLQELASSGKKGAANTNKGANERVEPSKVREVAAALDTTIAAVDMNAANNGLSPASREQLLRLWAHLDSVLSDDMKAKAHKLFADDADHRDEVDHAING